MSSSQTKSPLSLNYCFGSFADGENYGFTHEEEHLNFDSLFETIKNNLREALKDPAMKVSQLGKIEIWIDGHDERCDEDEIEFVSLNTLPNWKELDAESDGLMEPGTELVAVKKDPLPIVAPIVAPIVVPIVAPIVAPIVKRGAPKKKVNIPVRDVSKTLNVKGNRKVVRATYYTPYSIFKIPDGLDLEDKTIVKFWEVTNNVLEITYVGKDEVEEIEPDPYHDASEYEWGEQDEYEIVDNVWWLQSDERRELAKQFPASI